MGRTIAVGCFELVANVTNRRIIQMGEPPERVFNVGSMAIENMNSIENLSLEDLKSKWDIELDKFTIIGTFHPLTTDPEKAKFLLDEFCQAVSELEEQVVLTLGNIDTDGISYREKFLQLEKNHPERIKIYDTLGTLGYTNFLRRCPIMIGNSSSGVVEAASTDKVVVNIGDRQKGREFSENVIHTGNSKDEIIEGITKAKKLVGQKFKNIHEQEGSSEKIKNIIKTAELNSVKFFHDLK